MTISPSPASRIPNPSNSPMKIASSFDSPAVSSPVLAGTCAAFLLFAFGCGGGQEGVGPAGGDFLVLSTQPANNGQLFLNESIAIDFSGPVDLSSADLNSVSFQVFNLAGTPLVEQPQGTFSVTNTPGDDVSGRRLLFSPRFPTSDTFDDGGFRPGRQYLVQLPTGSTSLRDAPSGRSLNQAETFQFSTAEGTTPFELFRDTLPGGPRRSGFSVTQMANGNVPLGLSLIHI